jgi:hypothetical protein
MPKAGGRWNTYEITAKGSQLTVVLNGTRIVDVKNDWILDLAPTLNKPTLARFRNSENVELRPVRTRERNSRSIFSLVSALPADEISLWEWQEHRVHPGIATRAFQECRLDARGRYVIDDEPSTGQEARDYLLVDLRVGFRRLNIGEAKRDFLETGGIVESVAMKDLNRICRAGAADVPTSQGDLLFIEIDRRESHSSRASGKR